MGIVNEEGKMQDFETKEELGCYCFQSDFYK
jgi:hypothetical protein